MITSRKGSKKSIILINSWKIIVSFFSDLFDSEKIRKKKTKIFSFDTFTWYIDV